MKIYKKIIIFVLLSSIYSCTYIEKLFDEKKDTTPHITSNKLMNIENLWSTNTGDGRSDNSTVLQPYFDGINTIYSVDYKGVVTAIDINSGDKLWSTRTNYTNNITSGISYHNNVVYFGSLDAKLYGYDIDYLKNNESYFDSIDITSILTQNILEPTKVIQLDSEIISPAVLIDNQIFLKTSNGHIYAYDLNSQALNWKYIGRNIPLSIKGAGKPVVDLDNIYVAKDDGTMISLDQNTGKLNWLAYISPRSGRNELESLRDVEMTPLLLDDMIYVGSFQGSIIAININTGNTLWTLPLSSLSNIVNENSNLYITTSDGYLYSIDIYNGNTVWKIALSQNQKLTHPITYNDVVVVLNEKGFVYLIDRNDGSLIKYTKITNDIDYQINIIRKNNTIYVLSKDGKISAFIIN
ncbi:MAG: hypothetical protein CMD65_03325 [Gammaproteobacteria bacterium]|nr:hypothetical protein [Gammaproteobacteria bacterium]|tara:strand:- start:224 stop:1450 length:1227 start_codon:yes stop_codon:yes gene_type:complete